VHYKVGVGCEGLDDAENMVEILAGVSCPRRRAVNVGSREAVVDIQDHMNTSSVEDRCTLVVVEIGDQVVDSDSVDTKALQKNCISQASITISQRITSVRDSA
jgi:hypothetical protein